MNSLEGNDAGVNINLGFSAGASDGAVDGQGSQEHVSVQVAVLDLDLDGNYINVKTSSS